MAEYIDREAFLEHMKRTDRYFDVKFDAENFPTADVAPVVRCKDCKYREWDNEKADALVCTRNGYRGWNSGEDFCSHGERKDGDGNG